MSLDPGSRLVQVVEYNYRAAPSIIGIINMLSAMYLKVSETRANVKVRLLVLFLGIVPAVSTAEIIWSGDFSTGDFTQWHSSEGPPPEGVIPFWHMPAYGRPINYGSQEAPQIGNGDLMELVAATARTVNGVSYAQGPTRGSSEYSAKFTVKSLAGGGSEPADCDTVCSNGRRRTALSMQATHPDYYNAIPWRVTRWYSCSFYLPSDYLANTSSWGGPTCGLKPKNETNNDHTLDVGLETGAWVIGNTWSNTHPIPALGTYPWQYVMFYSGNHEGLPYPRSNSHPNGPFWPDGAVHFPDETTSHAALKSVNLGGWTDWVVQFNGDSRGAGDGGQGFLRVWKREDSGPWVYVLNVTPGLTNRGGLTFDHGIGYDVRPTSNNGGYGIKAQSYMNKSQVWNDAHNKVAYYANIKVGDENATFADMSPDGSSPDSSAEQTPPEPPTLLSAQ